MKIVFISNFFNHHQKFISDELYKATDGEYRFISTTSMPEERSKLGYASFDVPYVINACDNERTIAIETIKSADVIIIGSVDTNVISFKLFENKIVFRYSERPLKKGNELLKYPLRYYRWHFKEKINKNAYLLCASAFTYADYKKFGLFKGRALKWGYFPEAKTYSIDDLISNKKKNTILWCGRMLDWKHPDDAIMVAKRLRDKGYDFEFNIIGNGEMFDILSNMVKEYALDDCVNLLGSKPSTEVREYMEKSEIFLFTSDRNEGWGAVLNEAMNSGCAVVASHSIGAVPYMIDNSKNGLVYHSGNIDELFYSVKHLLDNHSQVKEFGKAAYETVTNQWCAKVAVENLLYIIQQIIDTGSLKNTKTSGPCSVADVICDNYF